MVPAAYAGATPASSPGTWPRDDVIIDGGNSYYRDDIQRAASSGPWASTTSTWHQRRGLRLDRGFA